MNLLLDTHAFIWWENLDPRLGVSARAVIANPANVVFVSAASVWEVAVKQRVGRLAFTGSPITGIQRSGFTSLAISGEHAEAAAQLPPIHQDPFDRMLIAQALLQGVVLVTSDRIIGTIYSAAAFSALTGAAMRTTIGIDDELLAKALVATGLKTKQAVVAEGLRTLVRLNDERELLDLAGKVR